MMMAKLKSDARGWHLGSLLASDAEPQLKYLNFEMAGSNLARFLEIQKNEGDETQNGPEKVTKKRRVSVGTSKSKNKVAYINATIDSDDNNEEDGDNDGIESHRWR